MGELRRPPGTGKGISGPYRAAVRRTRSEPPGTGGEAGRDGDRLDQSNGIAETGAVYIADIAQIQYDAANLGDHRLDELFQIFCRVADDPAVTDHCCSIA